jgi:alpha-D-ribose 1-methylphosphonate 5-triphosphate synthase subunit PhnI
MYVAVKGGEQAIAAAHALLAHERRGDQTIPEITPDQIREQLSLSVDRVMTEGSLYDRDLAALAIKQARGDLIEAIFLVRAYRTTLPRFGYADPLDSAAMDVRRRVSATFKDLPGGQILGPTFDYMHRLIDPAMATPQTPAAPAEAALATNQALGADIDIPHVMALLDREGLVERNDAGQPDTVPADLTRDAISFPAGRDLRLQSLARGDEGFLLALGYSTQRGYGRTHAFAGEIRMGEVEIEFVPEELGFAVPLGRITLTECEMVTQFKGSATEPPQFTRGYGLVFGQCERKAMSMALVDRALRTRELGEEVKAPAQDEEFVLSHSDSVQATGFVEHLKLPHYVDFQSELALVRTLRREHGEREAAKASVAKPSAANPSRKEEAE